jgi:hypothetical protein
MLKLKAILNVIKPCVESDFYIPIKVRFGHWNNNTEPRNCLGIKNASGTSLFEIGLSEKSGEIKYITLVLSPKICSEMPLRKQPVTTKVGLPAFDMQEWEGRDYYANEIVDFQVYLKDNHVLIEFSPNEIDLTVVNEGYAFGFDKNKFLCTIELDLSNTEKDLFEESLRTRDKL